MNHLSDSQLERYRQSRLPAAEVLVVGEHLAGCGLCRRRAEAFGPPIVLRALELEPEDEEPYHLSAVELSAYHAGTLGEFDRELADSHLEDCDPCRVVLQALQSAGRSSTAPPSERFVRPAQDGARSVRVPRWRFGIVPLPAAAIAVAAAGLVLWLGVVPLQTQMREAERRVRELQRSVQLAHAEQRRLEERLGTQMQAEARVQALERSSQRIAADNQRLRAQLRRNRSPGGDPVESRSGILVDGERKLLRQLDGRFALLQPLPTAAEAVLKTGKLRTPHILATLITPPDSLIRSPATEVSFAVMSPVGTVVASDRPAFTWAPMEQAKSYNVQIFDSNFQLIRESGSVSGTQWRPDKPLPAGRVLRWQVTARKEDGVVPTAPAPGAAEARFSILPPVQTAQLERRLRRAQRSHLEMGALYAEYGLLDDARREFEALAADNPGHPVAQRLLKSLRDLRERATLHAPSTSTPR